MIEDFSYNKSAHIQIERDARRTWRTPNIKRNIDFNINRD